MIALSVPPRCMFCLPVYAFAILSNSSSGASILPKPIMMYIAYFPYFCKIYKSPYFREIDGFCLNFWTLFLLPSILTMVHRGLHVLDASVLRNHHKSNFSASVAPLYLKRYFAHPVRVYIPKDKCV